MSKMRYEMSIHVTCNPLNVTTLLDRPWNICLPFWQHKKEIKGISNWWSRLWKRRRKYGAKVGHDLDMLSCRCSLNMIKLTLNISKLSECMILILINPLMQALKLRRETTLALIHVILQIIESIINNHFNLLHMGT